MIESLAMETRAYDCRIFRYHRHFNDCLTYAVAKLTGQSLLFVRNDFSQTDLEAA